MADSIIAYVLNAKKIVVYALGILAQVVSLGVLPAPLSTYASLVLVVATGIGIYRASNEPLDDVGDHAR